MRASRFVCTLLAVVLTAAACGSESPSTRFMPVADVPQLMSTVVEPAAEVYWDAVGWIIDAEGEHPIRPTSDEEWAAVRNAAFVIAESGNLLMMDGRAPDDDDAWMAMSQAMIEAGERAIEAAEARAEAAVFDMGAEIYYTCLNCHAVYATETLPIGIDAE